MNLYQNFGSKTDLVNNIYCCQLLNEKDGIYKQFWLREILKSIADYFKTEISNIKIIKDNLENKQFKFTCTNLYHQILLSSLINFENFEKYLIYISDSIIESYKNLMKQEEQKRKNYEKSKAYAFSNIISHDKKNRMLVKHLAFE